MKKAFILFLFNLLVYSSFSQCDLNGTLSVFGSTGDQTGHTVVQSTDGGYFLLGTTANNGTKIMVVRTDENMVKLWAKTYQTTNVLEGQAVVATSDGAGGCVFACYEYTTIRNAVCQRIDASGNVMWSKRMSASNQDTPRDIFLTSDNKVVLCGTTNSYGVGAADAFVQVFDIDGNTLWSQTVGSSSNDHFYAGMENSSGNYVFAGHADYTGSDRHTWMVEMAPNGTILQDALYSDGLNAYINDVCQDAEGSYYVVGCQFNNGNADAWVGKMDNSFYNVWGYEIVSSGVDRGLSIGLNSANEVVFTSISDALGIVSTILITRLEPTVGSLVSSSKIDYSGSEVTHILAKNSIMRSDDRIIVYGSTSSYGNGFENILCMTDPCLMNECINSASISLQGYSPAPISFPHSISGFGTFSTYGLSNTTLDLATLVNSDVCIYQGVDEVKNEFNLSVYPNPAADQITLNSLSNGWKKYHVFNLQGQLVLTGQYASFTKNIDVSNLSAGTYLVQVVSETTNETVRFEKK